MSSLRKADLIEEVANRTETSKASVARMLKALQDVVIENVVEGKKVSLTGFVSFDPYTAASRAGRNPRTGEALVIPERSSVRIRPLKAFKDELAK